MRTISKSLWLNFMLRWSCCVYLEHFPFSSAENTFVEITCWLMCLLIPLTAGDFGVHCWGFQVTVWDESPRVMLCYSYVSVSGGPGNQTGSN